MKARRLLALALLGSLLGTLVGAPLGALVASPAASEPDTEAVRRPSYLGVETRSNANMLESENVYVGLTVAQVVENSPAEAADLRVDDILLRAGDTELTSPAQLDQLVQALPVGASLQLSIERDRRLLDVELRTVERVVAVPLPEPPDARVLVERRRLGFEFRAPSAERAADLGLPIGAGAEVLRVARRSPFVEAGVVPGDVLVAANALQIESPETLLDFLDADEMRESVRFDVAGADGQTRELEVGLFRPRTRVVDLNLPPFLWLDREDEKSSVSVFFGIYKRERFETGSRYRVLWIFSWKTGVWDELVEIEESS